MDSRLRRKIDRPLRRPIARNATHFGVLGWASRWFTGMIHLDREKVDQIAEETLSDGRAARWAKLNSSE